MHNFLRTWEDACVSCEDGTRSRPLNACACLPAAGSAQLALCHCAVHGVCSSVPVGVCVGVCVCVRVPTLFCEELGGKKEEDAVRLKGDRDFQHYPCQPPNPRVPQSPHIPLTAK
eukprot:6460457-Amphidinium_carterae.1